MKKKLSLLALLFVAVSLALPYFSAAPARKTLIYSLETALSRQVRIQGATRIRLLPTPAILADEVTIAEDPSFSLEPFAYVTTIEVQPAFLALLSGRLEPARIRLTGFRMLEAPGKKLRIQFLAVNHGSADLPNISGTITLRIKGSPEAEPAATFAFNISSLPAFEAKDVTIKEFSQQRKFFDMPDWQFIEPVVEFTAPE